MNIDGTKINANTFGKNITNSSNTTTGSYVQTQADGHTAYWDANNQEYGVKNLPSKVNDNSFTDFLGKDSKGQFAKVGFPALKALGLSLTRQQALEFSQIINGNVGGGGQISVNLVSPPIVQNRFDTDEYILVRGANLDLVPDDMAIQILSFDKTTVVANIPNNHVTMYADGLSLYFYYNFHNFPVGTYFLRIRSGVKTYITTLDLKIVQEVTDINIAAITWERSYGEGITPNPSDVTSGGNVVATSSVGVTTLPTSSFKSSEIFAQGENFYLELKVDLLTRAYGGTGYIPSFVGVGYSQTENNLIPLSQVWFEYSWASGLNYYLVQNNGTGVISDAPPRAFTVIFIKTGNLFRTIIGNSNEAKTLSNNSGYSLFIQLVGRNAETPLTVQISKAFKFN